MVQRDILGFGCYRVLSSRTNVTVESIGESASIVLYLNLSNDNALVFDPKQNLLYAEVVQLFKSFFLPTKPTPSRYTFSSSEST